MLWTGIRISEAANLKWSSLDLDTNVIYVLGKGNKTRSIPLSDSYIMQIYKYKDLLNKLKNKKIFDATNDMYFFQTHYGDKIDNTPKPLSTAAIYKILTDIFKRANVRDAASPHTMRHTFASYSIKSGVSLPILSNLLGHASVSITTDNYYHIISEKQKRDEISKLAFHN